MGSEVIRLDVRLTEAAVATLKSEVERRNAEEGSEDDPRPWKSWRELAMVWGQLGIEEQAERVRERRGREAIAAREPAAAATNS